MMSEELEKVYNSFKAGLLPQSWMNCSYPTIKFKLFSYLNDLYERLKWYIEWIESGIPSVMYLGRTYFTQGIMSAYI